LLIVLIFIKKEKKNMKILKVMAVVALVCCGSSVVASPRSELIKQEIVQNLAQLRAYINAPEIRGYIGDNSMEAQGPVAVAREITTRLDFVGDRTSHPKISREIAEAKEYVVEHIANATRENFNKNWDGGRNIRRRLNKFVTTIESEVNKVQ
jgi:hypothetical protein